MEALENDNDLDFEDDDNNRQQTPSKPLLQSQAQKSSAALLPASSSGRPPSASNTAPQQNKPTASAAAAVSGWGFGSGGTKEQTDSGHLSSGQQQLQPPRRSHTAHGGRGEPTPVSVDRKASVSSKEGQENGGDGHVVAGAPP